MSGDNAPSITVRRPTLIDAGSDDEHMPSFNSPSPSPDLPANSSSPSAGQYRPKLETGLSQSHSPLLGDISAANTPTSPQDNPFDSYRMDGSSPAVSPAPVEGNAPPPMSSSSSSPPHEYEDYATGPFRNNASASSSSGGSADVDTEKVAAAGNRASLAPTEKSTATSTGRAGPLTAAERRMQRMSKITNKSKNNRQSARPAGQQMSRKAFQSTRLKEEIYKPWLEKKDPAMRWARWITLASILLGVAIMGVCEFFSAFGSDLCEARMDASVRCLCAIYGRMVAVIIEGCKLIDSVLGWLQLDSQAWQHVRLHSSTSSTRDSCVC